MEKKEADCIKHAQDFRDKYKSLCNQMGIQGENIKKELVNLLASLPEMYSEVAERAKKLKEPTEFYRSFVRQMITKSDDLTCLPLLQHVIGKGKVFKFQGDFS